MRLKIIAFVLALSVSRLVYAQERIVQNKPYADLRPFHFGVIVGTHFQDMELLNAGPQIITAEDGTTVESVVTADQDRWDMGFTVGVLGELRLSTHFQFRVAPTMYFGTRHVLFHDFTNVDAEGRAREMKQELKGVYVASSFDIIFSAPRFNNHRPYLMAGLVPMLNLSGKKSDCLRLNRTSLYAEVGLGCDFYLPFFKLRPELKFMYGLGNHLQSDHASELRDVNLRRYAQSVSEARTKIIALSFYFE